MVLSLKNIQKNRNTVLLIAALLLIIIGLTSTSYFIRFTNQNSPLVVNATNTTTKKITNTNNLYIWTGIEIGQNYDEIIKKLGTPSVSKDENPYRIVKYFLYPGNNYIYHEIRFIDNKAVYIKRKLDPNFQKFPISQITNKYGQPEILQQGRNIEVRSLYKYNIENNNVLVADVYENESEMFEIYLMNQQEYEKFKKTIEPSLNPHIHNLEPEGINY